MKWTTGQTDLLKQMCFAGTSNADMAECIGVPLEEIHHKRSQLGLTIAKVKALNGRNEYKFDGDEGNAEDASITASSETSNVPGNEHVFVGKGAAEKREIHDRLLAYREANGIGCLAPLVAAAKGVSQEDLRMMLGSAPMPLPKWLAVGKALDKIEKAASGADTPETAKESL